MVVSPRDLETELRNINEVLKEAIDNETGKVDANKVNTLATRLLKWINNFENVFLEESRKKLKKTETILTEGHKLAKEAFVCYEILCELEIEANAAPPTSVRWEQLPSGVVIGPLKAQAIDELSTLLNKFTQYRQSVIEL